MLHVIPAIAPRYGGPSHAMLDLMRALGDAGVEAELATTDADGDGRLAAVELGRRVEHEGVPTWFFRRQASEAYKLSLPLARWLARAAGGYDLIHAHAVFSHSTMAAAGAARRHRKPLVIRPLGSLSPWSLAQKPWRKRLALAAGLSQVLTAAVLHFTSEGEREGARRSLALEGGWVLPLGVDPRLFTAEARPSDDSPTVLALGRLHPVKGLMALIASFAEATRHSELAAWRLVLAGDGDPAYVRRLRATAAASTAAHRIDFLGWVAGDEKIALIERASLLALPSLHENFGLAAAEAMTVGVPAMVSTEVCLAPEISAAHAGWVVERDPPALARALSAALSEPEERRRRGEAARRLARQRFAWPEVARSLVERYWDLLAGRDRP